MAELYIFGDKYYIQFTSKNLVFEVTFAALNLEVQSLKRNDRTEKKAQEVKITVF